MGSSHVCSKGARKSDASSQVPAHLANELLNAKPADNASTAPSKVVSVGTSKFDPPRHRSTRSSDISEQQQEQARLELGERQYKDTLRAHNLANQLLRPSDESFSENSPEFIELCSLLQSRLVDINSSVLDKSRQSLLLKAVRLAQKFSFVRNPVAAIFKRHSASTQERLDNAVAAPITSAAATTEPTQRTPRGSVSHTNFYDVRLASRQRSCSER